MTQNVHNRYRFTFCVSPSDAEGVAVAASGGAGELPEVAKRLLGAEEGLVFGLDQAIHLSIDCACECVCVCVCKLEQLCPPILYVCARM